jgi:hypothetical protein
MSISQKLSKKISQKNVKANQSFHPYLKKFFIITYGLLEMSLGQTVPDPDLELISAKTFLNLNFSLRTLAIMRPRQLTFM